MSTRTCDGEGAFYGIANFSPQLDIASVFVYDRREESIFFSRERIAVMSFLYFLASLRIPILDAFFSLVTRCGEETVFMAIGMIVFWCINKYKGYYLLCVGFVGTVINQFLKILCRVPRPWEILQ